MQTSLCVCVCVCVHPQAIDYYSWPELPVKKSYTAFWFLYTAPAVDVANHCGRSKERHRASLSKTKERQY